MTTLTAHLAYNEMRVERRNILHSQYPNYAIIQLTLAIPEPYKNSFSAQQLFYKGIESIHQKIPSLCHEQIYYDPDGPSGLFVSSANALHLKEISSQIEENSPYSRLLDIDIYANNKKAVSLLSRRQGRTCFLCQERAVTCMRNHTHTRNEILQKVQELLLDFQVELLCNQTSETAKKISALAVRSLLYEAASYPSPGLVDPLHPGSHSDMDFFTFLNSSASLSSYFANFYDAGLQFATSKQELFPLLKKIGLLAESAMYSSTEKINTHKGIIFSMGLVLGTIGYMKRLQLPINSLSILRTVPQILPPLSKDFFQPSSCASAGIQAFKEFKIKGVRGEAAAGFPSVVNQGLPTLKKALVKGKPLRLALIQTLFALMTTVDDTTILHRQPHLETLHWVQNTAKKALHENIFDTPDWQEKIWVIDKQFVKLNISPGGSADMLSLTYFLYLLDTQSALLD